MGRRRKSSTWWKHGKHKHRQQIARYLDGQADEGRRKRERLKPRMHGNVRDLFNEESPDR